MEEYEVISIPISDGTERDFAIMDTFEFEGQGYLAVSLIEGDEIQEGVYIYPVCRKTPCFSYGDIRHFHRIYASN